MKCLLIKKFRASVKSSFMCIIVDVFIHFVVCNLCSSNCFLPFSLLEFPSQLKTKEFIAKSFVDYEFNAL